MDPLSLGVPPARIKNLEDTLRTGYRNIKGIIIVYRGHIVFERYNGPDSSHAHNVASVTKSIVSALIGIAIDKGHIKSLDQRVLEFFPEYRADPGDIRKAAVTLKDILTMTAPIASRTTGNSWEPLDRLRRQPDWVKYVLDVLGNGQPGKFQYSTAGAHLLSAVISRTTGLSAREFANKYLFKPIGMKEIPDPDMGSFLPEDVFGKNAAGWIKDPQGITAGGFGLNLTLRDMARFGFLYLNEGSWVNNPVLPVSWVRESTVLNSNNYGYMWWLRKEKGPFMYSALGSGGSMICCVPERDMIIAAAADILSKPKDPWELAEKEILPLFGNEAE